MYIGRKTKEILRKILASKEIINPIIIPMTVKAGITTRNRNPGKSLNLH
jgi:hypothetical protein